MATIAASAEGLAEIKAEDAKNTTAAETPAALTEEKADVTEGPSTEGTSKHAESEDATMDGDDKDKALRAVRQST